METRFLIKRLADKYDSFYLYDEQTIVTQINLLKKYFPSVDFLYSLKCNANDHVLKSIFSKGFGAGVSSYGEVEKAAGLGLYPERIFYSAPGKSMNDLQDAFSKSTIIADSISEIERLKYLAKVWNQQIEIGVRINPDFGLENEGGMVSKFGIDEKVALEYISNLDELYIKVIGIHTHIKNQELDCSKLNRFHKKVFQLAERVEYQIGRKLKFINVGSGIGIPYVDSDKDFNIEWTGKEMEERIANFRITHPKTKILMELGRFVVGKSGTYVTHVIDKKVSRGQTFVILQNTMNEFVRPAISCMVEKMSGNESPKSFEPFFTKRNAFKIEALEPADEEEVVNLVGNLCTSADVVAENVSLPVLNIGDVVTISNAGSYASVLSPFQFTMGKAPVQVFFTVEGEILE